MRNPFKKTRDEDEDEDGDDYFTPYVPPMLPYVQAYAKDEAGNDLQPPFRAIHGDTVTFTVGEKMELKGVDVS